MNDRIKSLLGLILVAAVSAAMGVGSVWVYQQLTHIEPQVVEHGDYSEFQRQATSPIVMFGTTTCPYCQNVRNLLAELNIAYHEFQIDGDNSELAQSLFDELQATAVPVLLIGNTRINGFAEDEIRQALSQLHDEPAELGSVTADPAQPDQYQSQTIHAASAR